jgi:hypothetical protein
MIVRTQAIDRGFYAELMTSSLKIDEHYSCKQFHFLLMFILPFIADLQSTTKYLTLELSFSVLLLALFRTKLQKWHNSRFTLSRGKP